MENRPTHCTAGIILAAGRATRLGQNKQLISIAGKRVIQRILDAAHTSLLTRLFLVLGPDSAQVERIIKNEIERYQVEVVHNPNYASGMSSSLKAGLQAASDFPSAMFLLGDQPLIDANLIDILLRAYWQSEALIVAPICQGTRRNPVIFDSALYGDILSVKGDKGARNIILEHPQETAFVEFNDPNLFLDIDTKTDLEVVCKKI